MGTPLARVILTISAGLLLGTTSAVAQPENQVVESVTVVPSKGAPGQTVQIEILCENPPGSNFSSEAITPTSAFAPNPEGHSPLAVFATGKVNDVGPGTVPVHATCEGKQVSSTFTVLPKGAKVPKGAPSTGGGGTAGRS